MILPHQPEDASIGFKVRRTGGNWKVFGKNGRPFNGRFQTITELPRGMSRRQGGVHESTVGKFLGVFN